MADVHKILNDIHLNTSENEDFLLINDELFNIIIPVFTCHENLKFVCKSKMIYIY